MLKLVKFKQCWKIFVGISAAILLLVCLSFTDKKPLNNNRPYMLIPSGWNSSALRHRNPFSGVSKLEYTSENVEASSSSLEELSDLTSKLTSKPFKNVTYHGHDLLKDVSTPISGLPAPKRLLLLLFGVLGLADKCVVVSFDCI